jgi:hypothetical protein
MIIDLNKEIHSVQDSTKIQDYLKCERMHFFKYILNLHTEGTNHNLVFGSSFHKAKDVLLTLGLKKENIQPAYEAFLEEYRKSFSPDTDLDFRGKNPANVLRALDMYVEEYKDQEFETLYTEIAITVPISSCRSIYGNMDSINKGPRGIFSLETKTAGAAWSYLQDSFMMKFQINAYTHFLYCYYQNVWGVVVDVTIFTKNPDNIRIPCIKSIDRMESWLYEANKIFDDLENDFELLGKDGPEYPFMRAFPRRTESCVQYNRICPYFDMCHSWNNPLQHLDEVPSGFERRVWDPRDTGNKVKLEIKDYK